MAHSQTKESDRIGRRKKKIYIYMEVEKEKDIKKKEGKRDEGRAKKTVHVTVKNVVRVEI